jgi:hypothetical protein
MRISHTARSGRLSRLVKKNATMLAAARSTSNDETASTTSASDGCAFR